jgi:hypothetical protein
MRSRFARVAILALSLASLIVAGGAGIRPI